MPRKDSAALGQIEAQIMAVLWERGACVVQDVVDALPGRRRRAYTTVQTMLNILCRKGHVRRTTDGRAFLYEAVLSREAAERRVVRDVVDRAFNGSADALVMALVRAERLDVDQLRRLANSVARARARGSLDEK